MNEIYENADRKCECWKCEKRDTCNLVDKFQRLPRTSDGRGGLGECPKLKEV